MAATREMLQLSLMIRAGFTVSIYTTKPKFSLQHDDVKNTLHYSVEDLHR